MQKVNGELLFSPSDLNKFMESDLCTWLDRYNLEYPGVMKKDEQSAEMALLAARGLKHEADYVEGLTEEAALRVAQFGPGNTLDDTIAAMQAGYDVIYQAPLRHENFAGIADFLIRVDGKSNLGDYHYEVSDTKLALKPKPYFLIQLCCYAEMLEHIQGVRPEFIAVVFGDQRVERFRTENYFYFYRMLKQSFLHQQKTFDPTCRPEPLGMEDFGRWQGEMQRWLEEKDHLSRVANIRTVQIRRLKAFGIETMHQLAETTIDQIRKMSPETFGTLKQQARLQVLSAGLDKPLYELLPTDPLNPKRGLAVLPPPSPNDVFFDMEGYPHIEGGLEYLFGATVIENNSTVFKDFWAHDRAQERVAFEAFIDWIYARWKQDPAMHVYHYAAYEVSAVKRLMGRYGSREKEVDELLRAQVFIDLFAVVRHAIRVGEPSYSIKNIEHLYMEKRTGDVGTAMGSVVWYAKWLEEQDGSDWQSSPILKAIRDYNQDDCESTQKLAYWLRERQQEGQIAFLPPDAPPDETERQKHRSDLAAYAESMIESANASAEPESEDMRIKRLLAHLLEFHWREARPIWWAMYERHDMTEQELIDDINCLGGLTRTSSQPSKIGKDKNYSYEYQFDPAQDTKLRPRKKTNCYFAHDLRITATVTELDRNAGKVVLKFNAKGASEPQRLGLIPKEYVPADVIERMIEQIVRRYDQTAFGSGSAGILPASALKPCLSDFLYRRSPRLIPPQAGSLIVDPSNLVDESKRIVSAMDETCLFIQGPPGSGKTHTTSHVIVDLLKKGKRVAVASNSHKAITNVLRKITQVALEQAIQLSAVNVGDDDETSSLPGVADADNPADYFANHTHSQLVGGTAFLFSREECVDKFDYLFIDEAGQVCIANLVAMSACAKNIVLVGDHMQLGQPIQGSHPGESGMSALDYYMKPWLEMKQSTIPDDHGIFLSKTYRLQDDICRFISDSIYDGKLQPEAITSTRILHLPPENKLVTRTSGILYIPVDHTGNLQGSEEELDVIKQLIPELLATRVLNKHGILAPLTLDDVLIVAPYNMQVHAIASTIPGARAGSVDKFQGQEAPVVIVSMCASDPDSSPRGMEFLLDKNRLNVAISRAQSLAIVIGSPRLARPKCNRVEQVELANLYCKIMQTGSIEPAGAHL
jgi:uncharacterized protein